MKDNIKSGIDNEVLQKAIEKYGHNSQVKQLQEECQELALAIHKLLNRMKTIDEMVERTFDVIDEIADVKIMIAQAEILFPKESINERVQFKMERLRERLKK